VQAKGIENMFNKTTAKRSQNLEKEMNTQVQEASRTPNRQDQERIYKCDITARH
jgi:hypothetical protein